VGKSTTIGVDLAKSVFEVAISKEPGRVSQRRRVSRSQMARLMADQAPSMVLMEACGSAHYWGRVFESQGHAVRLLPAHHVSRYRLGNKTDRADVDALLEAGRNERIFPVPVKSVAQQTLTALHRLRCEWVATRTARLNGLRGLLRGDWHRHSQRGKARAAGRGGCAENRAGCPRASYPDDGLL
jgi:transposase